MYTGDCKSSKQDWYFRTYGMSMATYCKLALNDHSKAVTEVREQLYKDKVDDKFEWIFDTQAKEIVGNERVAKIVEEYNLI